MKASPHRLGRDLREAREDFPQSFFGDELGMHHANRPLAENGGEITHTQRHLVGAITSSGL